MCLCRSFSIPRQQNRWQMWSRVLSRPRWGSSLWKPCGTQGFSEFGSTNWRFSPFSTVRVYNTPSFSTKWLLLLNVQTNSGLSDLSWSSDCRFGEGSSGHNQWQDPSAGDVANPLEGCFLSCQREWSIVWEDMLIASAAGRGMLSELNGSSTWWYRQIAWKALCGRTWSTSIEGDSLSRKGLT